MKILFVTGIATLPQLYGGMQTSCDQLCRSLIQKDHKVAVLAGFKRGNLLAWKCMLQRKILRRNVSRDTSLGYPVWRAWYPWNAVKYVTEKEKPDLIVVMAVKPVRMALAAGPTKIPMLVQLQDVETDLLGGRFEDLGNIPCIANSRFTAEKYHRSYGVDPVVIYPFVSPEKYKTQTTKENVTFINPVPQKGRDIALEIARLCPEIPFSFVEGLPLSTEERRKLTETLAALPNITLLAQKKDMRRVYGKCKILLAPSVWEEAFGRVVTEAQISGIPVVASTRGGLPEAVGPGGILLDPNGPIDDWVKAVRKLWHDNQYYQEISTAALAHAQRPEMSLAFQIDAHEQAFMSAIGEQ